MQYSEKYLRTLFEVCLEVRAWAEDLQAAHSYSDWKSNLSGMCAITSYELMVKLQAQQIPARFVKSQHHCFVMVDSLTLDLTATQFRNDDSVRGVLIVDRTGERANSAYAEIDTAETPDQVLELDCWKHWPDREKPLQLQIVG